MRKHSVRKWIHAILDLLPLFTIPIFALAVRSDNNFVPIEVQSEQYQIVDFNQIIDNVSNTWAIGNQDLVLSKDKQYLSVTGSYGTGGSTQAAFNLYAPIYNHIYYVRFNHSISGFGQVQINDFKVDGDVRARYFFEDTLFTSTNALGRDNLLGIYFNPNQTVTFADYNFYLNIYDLTQMFGVGNEPTISQFNTWYPNFYEYTLSQKELLNVGLTTLSDTDVGSQMVYTLYNTVDKYFNFNHIGVFGDLYDWFSVNFLGGNVPMSYFIVWNVILYEFVMDILFLTYMVFMFIIDFTEHLIDSFFDKAYRGGR